jgi:hypothetical protein
VLGYRGAERHLVFPGYSPQIDCGDSVQGSPQRDLGSPQFPETRSELAWTKGGLGLHFFLAMQFEVSKGKEKGK